MAPPSSKASRPGRVLAGLAALIVVLLFAIVGGDVAHPGNWSKDFRVRLGLDLTSGTTVALQAVPVRGHPLTQADMQTAIQIMIARVNGSGTTEAQVEQQGKDVINISVPGQASQKVIDLVRKTAELNFRQVLLLAPNTPVAAPVTTPTPVPSASASASPSPSGGGTPRSSSSAGSAATPSSSAHAAGLPGSAGAGAVQQMARHARPLTAASASPSPSASQSAATAAASPSASASASPAPTSTSGTSTWQQAQGDPALVSPSVRALFNKLNCANPDWQQAIGYTSSQYNDQNSQIVSCGRENGVTFKFALDKAKVVGSMIASASASPDQTSTGWQVLLNFKGAGTTAFGQLTTQMFDKYGTTGSPLDDLAVVLDGTVVSFPAINRGPITGGQAQITGSFSQGQATLLANQLSYGALPLSFTTLSTQSVSPQLGHDQLTAGLVAAAIGLGLVVIYLLLYYRGLALVAVFSLVIAAMLSWMSVILLGKYQSFALSLAGIAGLIVAIGITADSFVVFFERLRDEVREGRTLRTAVERGWTRARRTILVSDTVSFLAAALLYYFAIGSVRGFAFTLGLTTIIDVVVVFLFTKPMITLLARTKFYGGGHPLSGLDPSRLGARAPWRGSPRPAARVPARTTPAKEA